MDKKSKLISGLTDNKYIKNLICLKKYVTLEMKNTAQKIEKNGVPIRQY